MPTYTYRCNKCGYEFDKRQRISEAPIVDCPMCDGSVRRVVNAVGVVFKGSGFYITDSRNSKNASLGSASTSPPAEKSAGDSATSAAKSASSGSEAVSTPAPA